MRICPPKRQYPRYKRKKALSYFAASRLRVRSIRNIEKFECLTGAKARRREDRTIEMEKKVIVLLRPPQEACLGRLEARRSVLAKAGSYHNLCTGQCIGSYIVVI